VVLGEGFGVFSRPPESVCSNNISFFGNIAERSEANNFWGLLSYFSMIWLHKTVPFFLQRNKDLKADYYLFFTEVRD